MAISLAMGGPLEPCLAATDGPQTIYGVISGPPLPQMVPPCNSHSGAVV